MKKNLLLTTGLSSQISDLRSYSKLHWGRSRISHWGGRAVLTLNGGGAWTPMWVYFGKNLFLMKELGPAGGGACTRNFYKKVCHCILFQQNLWCVGFHDFRSGKLLQLWVFMVRPEKPQAAEFNSQQGGFWFVFLFYFKD